MIRNNIMTPILLSIVITGFAALLSDTVRSVFSVFIDAAMRSWQPCDTIVCAVQ